MALFSENLNIWGTASSNQYICSDQLNVIPTLIDPVNNRYIGGGLPPRTIVENETLNENELTIVYRGLHKNSPANTVTSIYFEINNKHLYSMIDGEAMVTYSSQNNNLYNVEPILEFVNVGISKKTRVTIKFMTRLNNLKDEVNARVKITYTVNDCAKNFYFNIILLPLV